MLLNKKFCEIFFCFRLFNELCSYLNYINNSKLNFIFDTNVEESGIGLSIVKLLVEILRETISLESKYGVLTRDLRDGNIKTRN